VHSKVEDLSFPSAHPFFPETVRTRLLLDHEVRTSFRPRVRELRNWASRPFPLLNPSRCDLGSNPETICNLLKTRVLACISARKFCEFASLASCENAASIRESIVEPLPQPLFAGYGL
jgi:hypothetical protein